MVFKDGNRVGYAGGVGGANLHVSESLRLLRSVTLSATTETDGITPRWVDGEEVR